MSQAPVSSPAAEPAVFAASAGCALEPIHTPNAVQPHGVLFVLSEDEFLITHISANAKAHLDVEAAELLGTPVLDKVHLDDKWRMVQVLQARPAPPYNPFKIRFMAAGISVLFDAILHRFQGRIILEIERTAATESRPFVSFFQETRDAMQQLRQSTNLEDLCNTTVEKIRSMTGFDRVGIYQFDEHWDGKVIAESCAPHAQSFLGYHFPEGDIPAQARRLYVTSRMRAIPDVTYTPAPILSHDADENKPVDLSMAVLRSVSPMHRQYAEDMGVQASMSISLLHEGRLWGLITCAHEACSLFVSYEVRTACEFLCEVFTSLIGAKEAVSDRLQRSRLKKIKDELVEQMFCKQDVVRGLSEHALNLMHVCNAKGAAICRPQGIDSVGDTPPEATIAALCSWLSQRGCQKVFVTDRLPEVWRTGDGHHRSACGIIAAPLSRGQSSFLIWFRPEGQQNPTWDGRPPGGKGRSANRLRQPPAQNPPHRRQGRRSEPWHATEIEAVDDLMRAVVDLFLQHSETLERLNVELERSNLELNAFAYAASHDLKEPLRGIRYFSQLVVDELGDQHLVGQSRFRMTSIAGMATRMDFLIDALLRYAHVGRAAIDFSPVDLDVLAGQLRETMASRLQTAQAQLDVLTPLGQVSGDAILLLEVLTNLVTNAVKYNDSALPTVVIGSRPHKDEKWLQIYVRDNGIGIEPRHKEHVFDIFRRLHGRDKFGGGSGAGLTIAQRIIQRHGGHLGFESTPGAGTTFLFHLPRPQ